MADQPSSTEPFGFSPSPGGLRPRLPLPRGGGRRPGAAGPGPANHARWDLSLPQFIIKQLTKPSFRSYVLADLRANRVVSMHAVYGLA